MKIALLYASWEDFGEPWSTPQGICNELLSRGHEVRHYNLYHDNGMKIRGVHRYSNQGINQLLSDFKQGDFVPDAILCMDYGPWDALQFDKKYFPGVVLLNEAGDEPQSHRMQAKKAPRVHFVLSPDLQCVDRYRSMGVEAKYWTHHADTRIFYPRSYVEPVFDCVTTCGSRGNGITDKIKKTLGDSFNNERYFYGEAHAERLCMGKIVFQCSQHKEVTRRIFEGMACGRLVLTDRLPPETGLGDMFIDGEDVVYYDDAKDAIDKIRYYASHDEEREAIARSGYNKVMQDHTQVQRCNVIEECIKEVSLV